MAHGQGVRPDCGLTNSDWTRRPHLSTRAAAGRSPSVRSVTCGIRYQTRVMVKKKLRRDVQDRAAEYVDSPLMTQRLRNRWQLSARIEGNYGVYRTSLRIGKLADSSCTCPSEAWPCKHIRALRLTWERNPKSFFNLVDFLEELSARSKPHLVETIGKMARTRLSFRQAGRSRP